MKKNTLITVLIALIVLVVAGYMYTRYFRPTYLGNPGREVDITLSSTQLFKLRAEEGQKGIYSIELELTGQATGIFDVVVNEGDKTLHYISLKGPNIDHVYKSDWYADSCTLRISPRNSTRGNLVLNYRFLSTD